MKRFFCFLILFSIVFGMAATIHILAGSAVAGAGFTIAYYCGEKT